MMTIARSAGTNLPSANVHTLNLLRKLSIRLRSINVTCRDSIATEAMLDDWVDIAIEVNP